MHGGQESAGPPASYQSITFGFVRLIVWNCLLKAGRRSVGSDGGRRYRCVIWRVVVVLFVLPLPVFTARGLFVQNNNPNTNPTLSRAAY